MIKPKQRNAMMSLAIYSLIFVSSLLFLILLILRLPIFSENGVIQLNLDSGAEGKLSLALSKEEASQYYPLSEKLLLRVGQTSSAFVNTEGKEELAIDFGFEQIRLTENQGYFVATEANSPRYLVFNKKGILYFGKTDYSILAAEVSRSGKLALLLDHPESKSFVKVFHEDGTENFEMTIQDEQASGFVVNLHFTDDEKQLLLTKLNLSSATPRPLITSYSLQESTLAQIQAEYKPDTSLIAFLKSTSQNQQILFGSREVMQIENGELFKKISYANLYAGGLAEHIVYLLASRNEGGSFYLKTWDVNDLSEAQLETFDYAFMGTPLQVDVHGRYMAVLIGKQILRFDLSRPEQPQSFQINVQVLRMRVNENGSLLLVTEEGIREILE